MSGEIPNPDAPRDETIDELYIGGTAPKSPPTVALTGTRQAFRDIRRQLEETELANPGVQKLLLEDLERAEAQCDVMQGYLERYHQADKRAAVLQEKLRTQTALEIMFGVGVGVGCAIIGLAPSLWSTANSHGPIALACGTILVLGASIGRMAKK